MSEDPPHLPETPGPDEPSRPSDPFGDEEVFFCDLCGAEMINRHCKLVCPDCGYQRDCSDP